MDLISLQSVLVEQFPPDHKGIAAMLYRQLYPRWMALCELHKDLGGYMFEARLTSSAPPEPKGSPSAWHEVPCPDGELGFACPFGGPIKRQVRILRADLVRKFVEDNILWAKIKVQQQILNIMWPEDSRGSPDSEHVTDANREGQFVDV